LTGPHDNMGQDSMGSVPGRRGTPPCAKAMRGMCAIPMAAALAARKLRHESVFMVVSWGHPVPFIKADGTPRASARARSEETKLRRAFVQSRRAADVDCLGPGRHDWRCRGRARLPCLATSGKPKGPRRRTRTSRHQWIHSAVPRHRRVPRCPERASYRRHESHDPHRNSCSCSPHAQRSPSSRW
jgi:hypothetical protein